ncbi:MAG: hypothetical protein J0H54_00745, partial [Rhizobiales bacterium]|nr:hypothetical protein [Hyphomicrobiales bacterium]
MPKLTTLATATLRYGVAAAALLSLPALASAAGPEKVLTIGLAEQAQCIDPQQDNYGYAAIEGRGLVDSLTDQ